MKKALSLFLATLLVLSTMSCLSVVSFGADADGNDTYDTATEITVDEKATGAISDSNDKDWYKFVAAEDYFTVNFSIVDKTNTNTDWNVRIYDSEMNELVKYIDTNSFASTKFAYSGDVYIYVEGNYDYANKNYSLTVKSFVDDSREDEYNNDKESANVITTNKQYIGELNDYEDVDWYKFDLTEDYFTVNFSIVDKTNTNTRWSVKIYDGEMNELAKYTDTNSFASPKFAYPGVVYICISSYYDVNQEDYQLKVNTFEDDFRETEYNDTRLEANSINTNQTYEGALNNYDDIDWYKFVSDKNYFTIDFSIIDTTNTTPEWNVRIYDENLTELQKYSDVTSVSTEIFANTGVIYVEVSNYYAVDKVDYMLRANTYENLVWEKENNNESTKANTIEQCTVYKGTLVKASDIDWFKFTSTTEAFRVKLNVDLNESSSDKIGDGWKISVKPVDSSVSLGEVTEEEAGTFSTRTLPYEKGKEYFVKVEANSDHSAPVDVIYNIVVEDASEGNKWEAENGKTDLPSATTVKSGDKIYGNLYTSSDKDYYKINVPASGKIKVAFNRTESELAGSGWKFTLVDAVGSVLETVDLGNSLNAVWTSKTIVNEGNYYIKMESVDSSKAPSADIDYNLTFTYTMTAPKLSSVSNASNGIEIKWSKVDDCAGYEIYRKAGSGSWKKLTTIKGESTVKYTDKSAKNGTKYSYKVRAYDGSTKSEYSSSKTITFISAPKAKSVSTAKSGVTFTWAKVSGASGYEVYRATGSGSYKKLVTVKSGSAVKFVDKSAKKGTTYKYKVRAYKGDSTSAFSSVKTIKDKY